MQHYSGASTLNKLYTKLYLLKQAYKEPVGVFLQKKYLLTLRLLRQATEH